MTRAIFIGKKATADGHLRSEQGKEISGHRGGDDALRIASVLFRPVDEVRWSDRSKFAVARHPLPDHNKAIELRIGKRSEKDRIADA